MDIYNDIYAPDRADNIVSTINRIWVCVELLYCVCGVF